MSGFDGFSQKWRDFPHYIIGITREIWEERGIETLNRYYAPDIVVRSPMGIQRGNQAVIASTMATCHEFGDRQLYADDVIWSDDPDYGLLSSHRLNTVATHSADGQFGPATGKRWSIRVIADCAAKNDTIYDEWLIRDYGGMVRQMGQDPRTYAEGLIEAEGGPESARRPFSPDQDIDGGYHGRGNDNPWGQRYGESLTRIMAADFNHIHQGYDRAVQGDYAGARAALGREEVTAFWLGLRSAFPSAEFAIHHQIGMDADMLSPRAALRWSLDGTHDGWGMFGRPSGVKVHVMGLCHAEFGPFGEDGTPAIRRECAMIDEVAIWKQILMAQG